MPNTTSRKMFFVGCLVSSTGSIQWKIVRRRQLSQAALFWGGKFIYGWEKLSTTKQTGREKGALKIYVPTAAKS